MSSPVSLRERLKQDSDQLTVLASAEMVERLTGLPQSLSEIGDGMIRALEEISEQNGKRLGEIAESARLSSQQASAATAGLADLQQSMGEAERSLTYQVERLKRQADRAQWMQTSVILLALAAGILGGIASALVILTWTRCSKRRAWRSRESSSPSCLVF